MCRGESAGGLRAPPGSGDHAHDVGFFHDQQLFAVELDFGARPLSEQHLVAGPDVGLDQLPGLVAAARAHRDDLALLRLLLGGIGDDDAAGRLGFGLDAADDDAVVQGTELELGHVFLIGAKRAGVGPRTSIAEGSLALAHRECQRPGNMARAGRCQVRARKSVICGRNRAPRRALRSVLRTTSDPRGRPPGRPPGSVLGTDHCLLTPEPCEVHRFQFDPGLRRNPGGSSLRAGEGLEAFQAWTSAPSRFPPFHPYRRAGPASGHVSMPASARKRCSLRLAPRRLSALGRFASSRLTPSPRSEPMQQPNREAVADADAAVPPGVAPEKNGPDAMNGGADPAMYDFLRALQAMRVGDFSVRMAGDQVGLAGKIADTFNEIVAANQSMAQQLERVGQVVGKEGKTRQRVNFGLPSGAWSEMEGSVNSLIDDLLWPTTEVTRAIAAVAQGDLLQTVRLDVDGRPLKGEFLRSATIVNTMIKQLSVFTSEVTRVAREVGTEGKLGGQAQVREVTGVWKDLTESVNSMASNLTAQVRNIADVTIAVANGDLSKKITVDVRGEILQLKEAINTMVDQLRSFASEVTRVAREVGTDGKLGGQAVVPGVAGTWKDLTDSVNSMASNLTGQVRNIAEVTTAVARGDLSRKITVDVKGEILELKDTLNTMVDQLRSFASEVTRVAREVGTDGKLGGQAVVPGVAGTWKDLTDSVNSMASNLTSQVRNIAEVTTAVAKGDLSRKITVDARGEILQLKNTINTMVDQLSSFASEVTRVAKEVGN